MEAYPLQWPEGWPRTKRAERSKFKTWFTVARDCLMMEIERMGGHMPVLSTNIPLRLDGLPYANTKQPDDKGVAVYFQYRGKPMAFACDKWDSVADNIQSIRKTIDALRGIERWGATDMMERAFQGFQALPAPGDAESPWHILGVSPEANASECREARNKLARLYHPDNGTCPSAAQMARVNGAFAQMCHD